MNDECNESQKEDVVLLATRDGTENKKLFKRVE